ncbi:MAG TPA: type II toxin-antitoxin system VapC family toxin [Rhizobiaceae bacterium]
MTSFVTDTSAIIAVLNDEPDAHLFKQEFHKADNVLVSFASLFEASCVMASDSFPNGSARLEALIELLDMTPVAFDDIQLRQARAAYTLYGRGSEHRAGLNMGDCFAYALAKTRNLPLLFKGDDFIHTDIRPALKLA